jgi:hypothetical protein
MRGVEGLLAYKQITISATEVKIRTDNQYACSAFVECPIESVGQNGRSSE